MRVSFGFYRGRLILARVRVEHERADHALMALDTGSRPTFITPGLALEIGFELADLEPTVRVVGVTGEGTAAEIVLHSVSVLGLAVENVREVCRPLPSQLGLEGILGLNFLSHFKIVIDNRAEMLTMEKWGE